MLAALSTAPGWGSWGVEPLLTILAVAGAWGYWLLYRRAARRSAPIGVGHWAPFAIGIAILALSAVSPLASLADGWLLTADTLQHVLLTDIAPALIVLGLRWPLPAYLGAAAALPGALAAGENPAASGGAAAERFERVSRALRACERLLTPWLVVPLWIGATWLWAIPAISDAAAGSAGLQILCHLTLLLTGLGLWWLVVDPLPGAHLRANGQRLGVLGVTHIASACVCIPLLWLSHPLYPLFTHAPRAYGISASLDQHIAGGVMTLIEFTVFAIAFAAVFISMLSRSDAGDAIEAEWSLEATTQRAAST